MTRSMRLSELADGLFIIASERDCDITGLCVDSRTINTGDAFIALPGFTSHGLTHLTEQQAKKVSVVLYQMPVPPNVQIPVNAIAVENLKNLQGQLANRFYSRPSNALTMIGVTGTNGKTSTVQMLAQAFSLLGKEAGTIGTLGMGLYGKHRAGERTTPDVIAVHEALAQMREAGAHVVAMEVSSHALDQGRVDGVHFGTAVFSNLSLDHLDYHGDMQRYFAAKAKLFEVPSLHHAIINVDDAYGLQLAQQIPAHVQCIRTSSHSADTAELSAKNVELSLAGLSFDLHFKQHTMPVQTQLLGRFNVDNVLAVAGVLLANGIEFVHIVQILEQLIPVDGRMSRQGGFNQQPLVVVDYAHTPDALEQALQSLRQHTHGNLVCVFGCGGDRDRSKRPLMAKCAEQYADKIWVTDDNPRTESGDAIVAEVCSGFEQMENVTIQRDRYQAIADSIAFANANDIVLIAGKGHETYQEVCGVKTPFDDRAVAKQCLQEAA